MRKIALLLLPFMMALLAAPGKTMACSTFVLESEGKLFVGHNLDENIRFAVPGVVVINKRNIYKESISNEDFYVPLQGKKHYPSISWVSKYGSVTFNIRGRDFPDGGMNEAGLTVFEMSLKGSRFKEDKALPTLMTEMWIQYQLDNFETAAQVIESTSKIMIDGRTWHFFVTDRQGNSAAIEYIKGKVVVHSGDSLPVPALCNSIYSYEVKRLRKYEGFGGSIPVKVDDTKIPRFVHAAYMLKNYKKSLSKPAVDYGFDILKLLHQGRSNSWNNKWSIMVDVKNLTVYFNTYRNREIRYFSLTSFDLSCDTPVKLLDIHTAGAGDVTKQFVDYSYESNLAFAKRYEDALTACFKNYTADLAKLGLTPRRAAEKFAKYPERTRCKRK